MFLQEPDRTQYDVRFRLFGVDIRIHPFFWLFMVLISSGGRLVDVLVWLAAVIPSLLIHEFGHVLAFRYYGIRSYIVLHAFGGLAIPQGSGLGYGPRLSPGANAVVAFAGPAVEILSALGLLAVVQAVGKQVVFYLGGAFGFGFAVEPLGFSPLLDQFVIDYVGVSLIWGLLNLLPIIPLDGGKISLAMFQRIDSDTGMKQALLLSMLTAGFVALLMFVRMGSLWNALLFVYLGFVNYQAYQQLGYGGRRW